MYFWGITGFALITFVLNVLFYQLSNSGTWFKMPPRKCQTADEVYDAIELGHQPLIYGDFSLSFNMPINLAIYEGSPTIEIHVITQPGMKKPRSYIGVNLSSSPTIKVFDHDTPMIECKDHCTPTIIAYDKAYPTIHGLWKSKPHVVTHDLSEAEIILTERCQPSLEVLGEHESLITSSSPYDAVVPIKGYPRPRILCIAKGAVTFEQQGLKTVLDLLLE